MWEGWGTDWIPGEEVGAPPGSWVNCGASEQQMSGDESSVLDTLSLR